MLELKGISKSFEDSLVLDDIDLTINTGEIISILGASGSGKTTLLNIILGISQQNKGSIFFNGEDYSDKSLEDRNFNIVFQDYALFPHLTAHENIIYGLKNMPEKSTKQEVEDIIDLFHLREHLNKKISELSGGQKQRVALARTIVMKPEILLLDEPLSALDGVIKEAIKSLIKEISDKYNLTTIIVTHDPEEALTMSDKVLILNKGRIAQYGSPSEITKQPANQYVEDFIIQQLRLKYDYIQALFNSSNSGESGLVSDSKMMVN